MYVETTRAGPFATPDEMRIDGERAAYRAHVAGRSIAYLNTEVWIQIGRTGDELAVRCRSLCETGVRRKRVIFPLSYAACSELVQQAPSPSRANRVRLMQALSEGISFRDRATVRLIEVEAALPLLLGEKPAEPDVSRLFAGVKECFSDMADPNPMWGCSIPDAVLWRARHADILKSLEDYVRLCDAFKKHEESKPFFDSHYETLAGSIVGAAEASRDRSGKINRQRAFTREAAASILHAVPALRSALEKRPPEETRRVSERARNDPGGPDRLREWLPSMPSVANEAELFGQRVAEPGRKHQGRNDFWDIEHAIVPAAYSDVWVTLDQNLAALVRRCDTPIRRGCRVLASLEELHEWLSEHG